jgi:cell division protein FtsI/penicillin-binding protein 2
MGLIGLALAARLLHLQVIEARRLTQRADRQRAYVEKLPASPGDLLDRQGRILATTVKVCSLFAIPEAISDRWSFAVKVAKSLRLDSDRLCERLAEEDTKKFLWIKRRLSKDEEEAVRKLELPKGTWGFREEFLRRYPQESLAAHVIGLRSIDGEGRGGLEQALDSVLRGQDGRRKLLRDARGRVIELFDAQDSPPRRGADIRTTLDSILQIYVERELDQAVEKWKPSGACAIVQDPKTGEILALASRPAFNPNNPDGTPEEAWKNRAIAWMYEPGSTFKPFVVAGALANGTLRFDEEINCGGGETHIGKRLLHDTHPYGMLSLTDVLVKSSNIGMARVGATLSNDQLHAVIVSFGFGRSTGSGLPGEMTGLLHPLREWSSYSNASLSMGQELAVTPLQLISAHCALANDGVWISPNLVFRTPELAAERASTFQLPTVISRATEAQWARWLVQGPMTEVVQRGTGTRARLEGYAVFGKTGTAQKLDPQTGRYSATKYVSSFVCGAPASNPRVVVLVVIDEPSAAGSHYGGSVAAPSAVAILKQSLAHLRIAPDEASEAGQTTNAIDEEQRTRR